MSKPRALDGTARGHQAQLDAWRASGADRIDPIGFLRIAHLVERLDAHHDATQRVLATRIDSLMQLYATALEAREAFVEKPAGNDAPLAELLAQMKTRHAAQASSLPSSAYPALPWLDEFRETWSALSARRRLHDARGQVPKNAGPLNSNGLMHRALTVMQELSPDYLRNFLAYADTLAGLESLHGMNGAPRKATARGKTA
jgi:hypothetical protein